MEPQSPRSLREFFEQAHENDLVHLVLRKDFKTQHRGRDIVVVCVGDRLGPQMVHSRDILGYVFAINEYIPGQTDHQGILHIKTVEGIIFPVPWPALEEVRTFTLGQTYRLPRVLSMPRYSPGA